MNHEQSTVEQPLANQPAPAELPNGTTVAKEVWARSVEEPVLAERIESFLRRFVFLTDESLYQLLSLWAVGTHLHEEFDFYGYLFLHSPAPQSGKTRLMEVLSLLVKNPTDILVSPTEAVLFRTAIGKTQLLDEVDTWGNEEHLRAVLNAGFKKTGAVARAEQTGEGPYRVRSHRVFCPRVLAGIGDGILNATTRDRTFMVRMERQTRSERRERFRSQKVSTEGKDIHDKIAAWVQKYKARVTEIYEAEDFECLYEFSDRTIDVASPLYAILKAMYEEQGDFEGPEGRFLEAVAKTRGEVTVSNDQVIFAELLRVARTEGELIGNAGELAEICNMTDRGISEHDISVALRRYGFMTKSVRRPGENPKYRYVLPQDSLVEIVERYGDPKDAGPASKEAPPEQK